MTIQEFAALTPEQQDAFVSQKVQSWRVIQRNLYRIREAETNEERLAVRQRIVAAWAEAK